MRIIGGWNISWRLNQHQTKIRLDKEDKDMLWAVGGIEGSISGDRAAIHQYQRGGAQHQSETEISDGLCQNKRK